MLRLLGTHGTSRTRAASIRSSNRFPETDQGHIGTGAYFWAYEGAVEYATELAEAWWKLANKKGVYLGDADGLCAVLRVEIEKPEDINYLDATQDWFTEALYKSISLKSRSADDTPEITAYLIDEIQNEAKTIFYVVKAKVATPPLIKGAQQNAAQKVSKMSSAYLVKKSGLDLIGVIEILNTEGKI